MLTGFFERWSQWVIVLTMLTAPVGIYGAAMALSQNYNNVEDWLPPTLQETQEYRWFFEHFQGDEVLIVSWPGCSLTDPRLERLAEAWREVRMAGSGDLAFRRVLTGQGVFDSLTNPPVGLHAETAKNRMLGWVLGPDRATTCAILMISPAGVRDRSQVLAAVRDAGIQHGLPASEIRIGGPTADSVAIDDESTRSLYQLSALSIAAGLLLAWFTLKSVRLVAVVFITAACCECWSLALVYFSGENMDAVLIIMPALVYVLAMCASIHLLNGYREVVDDQGVSGAAKRSLELAWQPTLMASVTTAIGLLSLCVSEVTPVRKFGLYSAAGVALSLAFLFLLLPALLERFPLRSGKLLHHSHPGRPRWDMRCSNWAAEHWRGTLAISLTLMCFFAIGAAQIRTSIRLSNMFYESSPVIQDYHWLEEMVGPLVPVDVVLEFGNECKLTMLERLELSDKVHRAVAHTGHVEGVASASTFVPPIPSAASARGLTQRVIMNRRILRNRTKLIEAGYLADAETGELWLVNGRVGAFAPFEYGDLVQQLKNEVAKLVDQYPRAAGHVRVVVCGGVPLINMVQRRLFNDLANSFGTALLTIGILLAIALRSLVAAAVLLLPNVFPVALVFGLMGWLGVEVDLGSMLTVSTALGITVDNELHFIAWFRRALSRGLSQREALAATFEHCGRPMVQTGVICGLGMLVFALSTFVPTARFGWLMSLLISTAMVGDLLILSASLASPLGCIFANRHLAKTAQIAPAKENPHSDLVACTPGPEDAEDLA